MTTAWIKIEEKCGMCNAKVISEKKLLSEIKDVKLWVDERLKYLKEQDLYYIADYPFCRSCSFAYHRINILVQDYTSDTSKK